MVEQEAVAEQRTAETLELERRFPGLRAPLRVRLTELPTRVHRWRVASEALGEEVWIKRDDESSPLYGGNKPRKLEFLLAQAIGRGRRGVLTFGGLGTHHGLATAIFARQLGLRCTLGLLDQPLTPEVRENLLALVAAGAEMFCARSVGELALRAVGRYLALTWSGVRPMIIPTGGSGAAGTVAFVNAGLEFATQVSEGQCPSPTAVYVALGSGGTAAGLALGFALAGLPCEVRAVLVTDILPPGELRLRKLAEAAWRWLQRAGAALSGEPPPLRLRVVRGFVGRGYGWPTPEAEGWRARLGGQEGVRLDPTYTAKCVHALCSEVGRGEVRGPVVFWHTYSQVRPQESLGPLPSWRELPKPLQRFFAASEANRGDAERAVSLAPRASLCY